MGKYFFLIVFAGFLALSCNQKQKNSTPMKKTDQETSADIVSLRAAPDVVKLSSIPDMLTIQMSNATKDTLTTGLHYDIQKLENEEWVKVLPEQSFQDIGVLLLPSESKVFTVRTRKDQAVYQAGNYRVVKYYLKPDFQKSREQFFVYAEFYIE